MCVVFEIFVNDKRYALSKGIFFCNVHFLFNGLPQYFSLISTVYDHWWIIQSHTSNRCQRIQNDFPWIIYYFQKSNRFVEQVIGNTDVDQGLSAGNKIYCCFPFRVSSQGCVAWGSLAAAAAQGAGCSFRVLTGGLEPCPQVVCGRQDLNGDSSKNVIY